MEYLTLCAGEALDRENRIARKMAILCGREFVECHYCGERLNMSNMTLDHVVPVSKDGSNSLSNLIPACRKCNQLKADMSYKTFFSRCKRVTKAFKKKFSATQEATDYVRQCQRIVGSL